jgi:hypothetical protein
MEQRARCCPRLKMRNVGAKVSNMNRILCQERYRRYSDHFSDCTVLAYCLVCPSNRLSFLSQYLQEIIQLRCKNSWQDTKQKFRLPHLNHSSPYVRGLKHVADQVLLYGPLNNLIQSSKFDAAQCRRFV